MKTIDTQLSEALSVLAEAVPDAMSHAGVGGIRDVPSTAARRVHAPLFAAAVMLIVGTVVAIWAFRPSPSRTRQQTGASTSTAINSNSPGINTSPLPITSCGDKLLAVSLGRTSVGILSCSSELLAKLPTIRAAVGSTLIVTPASSTFAVSGLRGVPGDHVVINGTSIRVLKPGTIQIIGTNKGLCLSRSHTSECPMFKIASE